MTDRPPPSWEVLQQRIGAMIEGHIAEHKRFNGLGKDIGMQVLSNVFKECALARKALASGQPAGEVLDALLGRIDPQLET